MKKLTDKQEKFAQLVVKYGNQSKAYREAYDVKEGTKDSSINVEASKLMANPHIYQRATKLREDMKAEHKIDRDYIIKGLIKIIEDVDYTIDLARLKSGEKEEVKKFYMMRDINTSTDKLRAYDMLIKMHGFNAPEKVEQEIKIEIVEKRRD